MPRAPNISLACALAITLALAHDPARAAERGRPDAQKVKAELEEVLSDPRFQRTRPDAGQMPVPEPPSSDDWELPDFRPRDFEPSAASGVSEALLWVLLGLFGVALVGVLGREGARYFRGRKRKQKKKAAAGEGDLLDLSEIALQRLPASLSRARELAAQGRYEEAVHVLLEGGLGYLHTLAHFSLEPAFTSREVLARAPLTSETRRAFKELVMTVEVSLFGGLPVDAADFGRCEESFVTLHHRLGGAHVA